MTADEYEILFYVKFTGECPVDRFLDSLPVKVRAKLEKWMQLLEECGPDLPRPYADTVREKIRELRVVFGSNQCALWKIFMKEAEWGNPRYEESSKVQRPFERRSERRKLSKGF